MVRIDPLFHADDPARAVGASVTFEPVGLGCMGMSFGHGPAADRQEMITLIPAAVARAEKKKATTAQIAMLSLPSASRTMWVM